MPDSLASPPFPSPSEIGVQNARIAGALRGSFLARAGSLVDILCKTDAQPHLALPAAHLCYAGPERVVWMILSASCKRQPTACTISKQVQDANTPSAKCNPRFCTGINLLPAQAFALVHLDDACMCVEQAHMHGRRIFAQHLLPGYVSKRHENPTSCHYFAPTGGLEMFRNTDAYTLKPCA